MFFLRFMIVCYLIFYFFFKSPKSITLKFTFFFPDTFCSLLTYVTHRPQSRWRYRFDESFIDFFFIVFFPIYYFCFKIVCLSIHISLLFTISLNRYLILWFKNKKNYFMILIYKCKKFFVFFRKLYINFTTNTQGVCSNIVKVLLNKFIFHKKYR